MRVIAVTGHRPDKLGGYVASAKMKLQRFAAKIVAAEAQKGPVKFVTGMALGWDQAIAFACVQAGVPWLAAIPFVGQETRWPLPSRQEYERLLWHSTERQIVCAGDYAAWKLQKRNEWMVNQVSPDGGLIALWNGTPGGTANCVAYAMGRGVRILNHWQDWSQFE